MEDDKTSQGEADDVILEDSTASEKTADDLTDVYSELTGLIRGVIEGTKRLQTSVDSLSVSVIGIQQRLILIEERNNITFDGTFPIPVLRDLSNMTGADILEFLNNHIVINPISYSNTLSVIYVDTRGVLKSIVYQCNISQLMTSQFVNKKNIPLACIPARFEPGYVIYKKTDVPFLL